MLTSIESFHQYLTGLIGEVNIRSIFGASGFYKNDLIFSFYQNGEFYIKAQNQFANRVKNIGGTLYQKDQTHHLSLAVNLYYNLPPHIIYDPVLFKKLLILAIKEAIREQERKANFIKLNNLKQLPNLNLKHERLLKKIRCYSVSDFMTIGALNAVVKLIKKEITIRLETVLDFVGAEKKKWVSELSEEEKLEAITALNAKLKSLGLRESDINELKSIDGTRKKLSLFDIY